jgi:hypothetical protein
LSILLAELRPLFFRHGLRRDKDESVELEFNFLISDPDFAFLWQQYSSFGFNHTTCRRRLISGAHALGDLKARDDAPLHLLAGLAGALANRPVFSARPVEVSRELSCSLARSWANSCSTVCCTSVSFSMNVSRYMYRVISRYARCKP